MLFNAPINKERELLREYIFVYMYSCLNEIIAFRFSFKDNSSASILILYIELIVHPLYVCIYIYRLKSI
jgi:hypothetical protein